MEIQDYITSEAKVMLGKPVIKGTRITVELILEKLSEGETIEAILEAHPHITEAHIDAAIKFADTNSTHIKIRP